jgi:predicted NACHT family NTPase
MDKPVPLRNLYVRLHLLPKLTARHRASIDELEKLLDRDKRHFAYPERTREATEIINKYPNLLVLGKPGSGKTTLLKYIALQAIAGKLETPRIPILIGLKDWSLSGKSILDFIVQQFDICSFPDAQPFVERILEKGHCLLLMDGLDEMTGDVDAAIFNLRQFADKYTKPQLLGDKIITKNQFVFSCRIAAYNYVFETFVDVEIADFNTEQIREFVRNWFQQDPASGDECWDTLNNPAYRAIKELASTPLLLTMLCLAFSERLDFPHNRAELYKEGIDALLKKWDSSRRIHRGEVYKRLSLQRKQTLLERLAYNTFCEGQYFIPQRRIEAEIATYIENLPGVEEDSIRPDSEAILKSIEANHGLLVERAAKIYSFSHLTVQEYFTARHILESRSAGEAIRELIHKHLLDDRWREVILLAAGMLTEADDFLTIVREEIGALADKDTVRSWLTAIEGVVLAYTAYPKYIARAFAAFYFAHSRTYYEEQWTIRPGNKSYSIERSEHGLLALCLQLAKTRRIEWNVINDLSFAKAVAYRLEPSEIDLDRALQGMLDLHKARNANVTFDSDAARYLQASSLLVECLLSDCYVAKSTRERLLDGLLKEP